MTKTQEAIFNKVFSLDRDLQTVKLNLRSILPRKERKIPEYYDEQTVLREVRKLRKKLWNGRYSKAI